MKKMTTTLRLGLSAMLLFLTTSVTSAQNRTSDNQAVSDTAIANRLNRIQECIKAIDQQILDMGSSHFQAGLTLEMQERAQMHEDSIRTSLLSKRTELELEAKEIRRHSMRRIAINPTQPNRTEPSARPQAPQQPTTTRQTSETTRELQRIYRQNQQRTQRRK
jgi:hypothetical protein